MEKILQNVELPEGFSYPADFLRLVEQGLIDFDPWVILLGEQLRTRYQGLQLRYPSRKLVPFARRYDNDDIACWDKESPSKVLVIHDFASSGYEEAQIYEQFWDWFRDIIEAMISHDP